MKRLEAICKEAHDWAEEYWQARGKRFLGEIEGEHNPRLVRWLNFDGWVSWKEEKAGVGDALERWAWEGGVIWSRARRLLYHAELRGLWVVLGLSE